MKTRGFKDAVYVGDPVNAVRIFSEKEADEIVVLDIDASREGKEPNYELIAEIAGEAFMPVTYGGGIKTVEQIRCLIRSGVEKAVINTSAIESTDIIRAAVEVFGSQAIVGGVDVGRNLMGGYRVTCKSAIKVTSLNLQQHIHNLVEAGVGELFINDIELDGCMTGYDMALVRRMATIPVPVVVCGGAGTLEHLREAVLSGGACAVAAGSMFVFHGKHKAVLINYPRNEELQSLFVR